MNVSSEQPKEPCERRWWAGVDLGCWTEFFHARSFLALFSTRLKNALRIMRTTRTVPAHHTHHSTPHVRQIIPKPANNQNIAK
jgi:hypothetical protein